MLSNSTGKIKGGNPGQRCQGVFRARAQGGQDPIGSHAATMSSLTPGYRGSGMTPRGMGARGSRRNPINLVDLAHAPLSPLQMDAQRDLPLLVSRIRRDLPLRSAGRAGNFDGP